MKRPRLWIAVLALAAAGCNAAKSASSSTEATTKSTTTTATSDTTTGTTSTGTSTGASSNPATTSSLPPAMPLSALPDNLKNAAYDYEGLGNDKPMDMEVTTSNSSTVITGSQTVTLTSVKDGKATFHIERTGGLADLEGSEDDQLSSTGIIVTASDLADVGPNYIEMPADLHPGATWPSHTVVSKPGKELDTTGDFKVVGTQPVTTKKASYKDALLVTSTGKGKVQGQPVRMETKSWYVKGVGMVKSQIVMYPEKGQSATITIQETK